MTGERRLADDGVPDAGRRAVLRGHVLPAEPRTGCRASRRCWRRSPRRGPSGAPRSMTQGAMIAGTSRGSGAERLRRAADRRDHARRVRASAARVRRRARRLRRRAEVPAADDARVRAPHAPARVGARRSQIVHDHARPHGRRRDLRPARRRLPPVLDGRAVARPALREDALRQRAARAAVPRRVAGDRRRAVPACRHGDPRLPAPRDAAPRGRVLLLAGRRQRGRRGEVLRLGVGRAGRDRRAGGGDVLGATRRATGRGRTSCGSRGRSGWSPTEQGSPRGAGGRVGGAPGLFETREGRIHPATDDKILAAWNGLAIAAFAEAGRVLDEASTTSGGRSAARSSS